MNGPTPPRVSLEMNVDNPIETRWTAYLNEWTHGTYTMSYFADGETPLVSLTKLVTEVYDAITEAQKGES